MSSAAPFTNRPWADWSPFEQALNKFHSVMDSQPPFEVFTRHTACNLLAEALAIEHRRQIAYYAEATADLFMLDAARIICQISLGENGEFLHEGQDDQAMMTGEVKELWRTKNQTAMRDRANVRDPTVRLKCYHELFEPSASIVHLTVAAQMIAVNPPRMSSASSRARRAIQQSFFPQERDISEQVQWGQDGYEEFRQQAINVFQAGLRKEEGWHVPLFSLRQRINLAHKSQIEARETAMATPVQRGFKLTRVGDIGQTDPEFLIENVLETDSIALIFGDPGSAKSFLALDMAACIATDHSFHGRKVRQGSVIYLAGEGQNGLKRRFDAWRLKNELSERNPPLFFSNSAPPIPDHRAMTAVRAVIEAIVSDGGPISLIIIDTVARSFGGFDENATKDMSLFVSALDQLRLTYGCTILLVHHTGHSDKSRARGNQALKGALDAEYKVEKVGDQVTLECTKMKEAEMPKPMTFILENVALAPGKDGKPISSAALILSDARVGKHAQKMSGSVELGIRTFEAAVRSAGCLGDDGTFAGVPLEAWRKEFYAEHTGDNRDSKKRTFQRVRNCLVDARRIRVKDDVYFPDGDNSSAEEARLVEIIKKRDIGT